MENNRMCFEVDASSIDFKNFLQKDFLELSMRVISDANPNVNKSWFTPEAMQDALPTFVNKPILGYFENGDFVSHDGEWNYDSETEMSYWDTLGKKGERILGMIRESDGVEIVEGKDGLKWIELKCCLWVQYGYKQVKRLLKDAKKAKENGGLAKNVSVEVDILDGEKMPNGVLKINKFNLIGITILGSRNGVKVEPGIENAGLSVIDIMGTDVFEAQQKALRLAYEKLGGPNTKKEEFSNMDQDNLNLNEDVLNSNPTSEPAPAAEPQTEEQPATTEPVQFEGNPEGEPENTPAEPEGEGATNTDVQPTEEQPAQTEENPTTEEPAQFEGANACPCEVENVVYDLTYLLRSMNSMATEVAYIQKYYESAENTHEAIIAFLDRLKRQYAEDIATLGTLVADATEEFKTTLLNFEKEISEDTVASLYKKYEDEKAKNVEYTNKMEEAARAEFLKQAQEMINFAEFTEDDSKAMYALCESGEIKDIESLKSKIALKLFEAKIANKNVETEPKTEEKPQDSVISFNAPVNEPTVPQTEKKKAKTSCWDALKEYTNN